MIATLGLLGSVFLSATANGIAIFTVFGAGLVAGLLGQIGEALGSETLQTVADGTSWALPFEALYRTPSNASPPRAAASPASLSSSGPFGGSGAGGANLPVFATAYFLAVLAVTLAAFAGKDL